MTKRAPYELISISPNLPSREPGGPLMNVVSDHTDVHALAIGVGDSLRTTLAPEPWSGYVARSDSIMYHGVLAAHTGTRVVGLDNPGVGSGSLSREDRLLIASGDFRLVSEQQWQSIGRLRDKADYIEAPTIAIGYSLGAVATSSLVAEAPEGTQFERLVLWESVGLEEIPLPALARRFASEQSDWGKYKKENPENVKALQPSVTQAVKQFYAERKALLAYGRSSTRATVIPNLLKGKQKRTVSNDTEIIFVSGTNSRVSPPGLNSEAVDYLAENGFNIRQVILETESHGVIDSLGRVAGVLDYLWRG